MTDSKLRTLIDRAVKLDRDIADQTTELKEIKAQLIVEATSRQEEQRSIEGSDGTKWTGTGNDGCLCRVTFPAPKLKSSVDPETKPGQKIIELAGTAKQTLFTPSVIYRPIEGFRDKARELLGKGAEKLIKACETESNPRVEFETKTEA